MSNLITIQGVRGYVDENGTVYLDLEDVSRGLGFTQEKHGKEYVRWETVRGYLFEFGFSQEVGKDPYIPENIFYRMAMKAKNEIAERFQAKVADEILPSIRKTGQYSVVVPQTFAEALRLAADLEEEKQKLLPKAQEFDKFISGENYQDMNTVAKALGWGRNKLFAELRNRNVLMSGNKPYQRFLDSGYFVVKEKPIEMGEQVINKTQTYVTSKGVEYISKMLNVVS